MDRIERHTILRSEHVEQREFVSWFRKTYYEIIFAIPNGGTRNKKEAAKLKVEGVLAGIPDLYVPEWNLWIEMKKKDAGRLSPKQKEIRKYLIDIGHSYILGAGYLDARDKVLDFVNTNFSKKGMIQ